jgi:hypothetical protein
MMCTIQQGRYLRHKVRTTPQLTSSHGGYRKSLLSYYNLGKKKSMVIGGYVSDIRGVVYMCVCIERDALHVRVHVSDTP